MALVAITLGSVKSFALLRLSAKKVPAFFWNVRPVEGDRTLSSNCLGPNTSLKSSNASAISIIPVEVSKVAVTVVLSG